MLANCTPRVCNSHTLPHRYCHCCYCRHSCYCYGNYCCYIIVFASCRLSFCPSSYCNFISWCWQTATKHGYNRAGREGGRNEGQVRLALPVRGLSCLVACVRPSIHSGHLSYKPFRTPATGSGLHASGCVGKGVLKLPTSSQLIACLRAFSGAETACVFTSRCTLTALPQRARWIRAIPTRPDHGSSLGWFASLVVGKRYPVPDLPRGVYGYLCIDRGGQTGVAAFDPSIVHFIVHSIYPFIH